MRKRKAPPLPEVVEDCEENQRLWRELTSPAPLDAAPHKEKGFPSFLRWALEFASAISCIATSKKR